MTIFSLFVSLCSPHDFNIGFGLGYYCMQLRGHRDWGGNPRCIALGTIPAGFAEALVVSGHTRILDVPDVCEVFV